MDEEEKKKYDEALKKSEELEKKVKVLETEKEELKEKLNSKPKEVKNNEFLGGIEW